MQSATQLQARRVDHRGQALPEWIIVVGTIALVAVLVFAVLGAVLQRQSSQVASEIAGAAGVSKATSTALAQPIIQLAGLSGLRGLFSRLPGAGNDDPAGGGTPGYGSFTPIPSATGAGNGSPSQCNPNDGQAGVGARGTPPQGVGNPIHVITGNKYQEEIDLPALPGTLGLRFSRHYNSANRAAWGLGQGWRHSYQVQVRTERDRIWIWQADGRQIRFDRGGAADADGSVSYPAQRASDGELRYQPERGYEWRWISGRVLHFGLDKRLVRMHEGSREIRLQYDTDGRLVEVRDPHQRTLHLSYYANGRLATVKGPNGNLIGYRYDAIGNLTHVIYADNTFRRYHYEDQRHPHHLTGIGISTLRPNDGEILAQDAVRWSTYRYDAQGRGVLTMHTNGLDQATLTYGVGEVRVTDAVGRISTYVIELRDGVPLVTAVYGRGCSQCGPSDTSYTYTKRFQVATVTTPNGITIRNTYDDRGRLSMQHRVLSDDSEYWLASYQYGDTTSMRPDLPLRIERPSVNPQGVYITDYRYTIDGQPVSIAATGYAPVPDGTFTTLRREKRNHYDDFGRLVAIDGTRTDVEDVLRLTYDADDQLQTITAADGSRQQILARDRAGRPTQLKIDGQPMINMRFSPRGDLAEVSQQVGDEPARSVRYTYSAVGLLMTVTDSTGERREFLYDSAGRRTQVHDGTTHLSQQTEYAEDGEIVGKHLLGPQLERLRSLRYIYDTQRRLSEIRDMDGETLTTYRYENDQTKKPSQLIGPRGQTTSMTYDPLGRLVAITRDKGGVVTLDYDTQGLSKVTDPKGQTTAYRRDDFGRIVAVLSPDAGATWYTYDSADNIVGYRDARGEQVRISYDAANRPVQFSNGDGDARFGYQHGKRIDTSHRHGREHIRHDHWGRVAERRQALDGHRFVTAYRFDPLSGRLIEKTIPDGQVLRYHYQSNGTLRAITRQGLIGDTTVIEQIQASPHEGHYRYTHGNGIVSETVVDIGRGLVVSRREGELLRLDYGHDAAGQITVIDGRHQWAPPFSNSYDYDGAGRLVQAHTQTGDHGYTYDTVGNRISQTRNGKHTRYHYGADNNHLLAIEGQTTRDYTYDAAGNPLRVGERRYVYNSAGRPVQLYIGARLVAEYAYNARGERIRKTRYDTFGEADTTYYLYEDGRLTGETDSNGRITAYYVYLNNRPVAVLKNKQIYAIHTDHLGTPMAVTDSSGQRVWHADYDPFGKTTANQDPDNDGQAFSLPLRFPGQYADSETDTYYNYFRDYDPSTGRYLTSDPTGLPAGLNTYVYVNNDPLRWSDPKGKAIQIPVIIAVCFADPPCAAALLAGAIATGKVIGDLLNASIWDDWDGVLDPDKPIPPQLPGYVDPKTWTEEVGIPDVPFKFRDCVKEYERCVSDCKRKCANVVTRSACRTKCVIELWICQGGRGLSSGDDDVGGGELLGPGVTGF